MKSICKIVLLFNIYTLVAGKDLVQTLNKPLFQQYNAINSGLEFSTYEISDAKGIGRKFDGIGGLSGGGATSRLLVNYRDPYRSQILDLLFKPQFGASLHILKVEIGGDAQSTEGTEHSHMHTESEEDYTRGYEWWLMKEAKSRNPDIKLVGLPWGWPGWIGQGTASPYTNRTLTATYIAKWLNGAKVHHNLTIDFVGIWNEKAFDVLYIKELRNILDLHGLSHVQIIASDSSFDGISEAILSDIDLARAVDIIGAHYPGTHSTTASLKTKKQLWASEDYSTFNDNIGGGCLARLLNQNYVNGNMTATISWNLVASYYDNLPFKRCSLMTANEPWSGHYEVTSPLWVSAHTTQFTLPGWLYLTTVGHLQNGGTYVALTDGNGNLTIIIETMSHNQSICIRPPLPKYDVHDQNASFVLSGSFKGRFSNLNFWHSQLGPSSSEDQIFIYKGLLEADDQGKFTVNLKKDVIVTLSTITTAKKGSYASVPPSSAFPIPYTEDFNPISFSEAYNFADQSGAFENFHNASSDDGHEYTFRQAVTQRPVTWCDDPDLAITYIGDYSWSNVNASVKVKIEGTAGALLALRVDRGGCQTRSAKGVFFWLNVDGSYALTTNLERSTVTKQCETVWQCWKDLKFLYHGWNDMSVAIKSGKIYAYLNGKLAIEHVVKPEDDIPSNGFVAIGTKDFQTAQFDDFAVSALSDL